MKFIPELFLLLSFILVSFGVYLIYGVAIACIESGIFLAALAIVTARARGNV